METKFAKSQLVKFFIKMKKGFPKGNLIYVIILLLKLLPLVIVTHDWNINYGKGVSMLLLQGTLGPILFSFNSKFICGIIILILFIVTFIGCVIFIYSYYYFKNYQRLFPKTKRMFYVSSYVFFCIHFAFNQNFYTVMIENYFCNGITDKALSYPLIISYNESVLECRNAFNYGVICIQSALLLFMMLTSYLITIFNFEPLFTCKKLIVSAFNDSSWKWFVLPILQGIIQLEYHVPFHIIIPIKCIIRGLYVITYLVHIKDEYLKFYSSYEAFYFQNFIFSMCFVSCIIEFIFLFDLGDNLIFLQSDYAVVVLKILIEGACSALIMKIIRYYEIKKINDFFIDMKNLKRPYDFLNKYFSFLSRVEINSHANVLLKIIQNFFATFTEHKKSNKCAKINSIECFCRKYEIEDFYKQSSMFLSAVKTIRENIFANKPKLLKVTFPLLYSFIEYSLLSNIEKSKTMNGPFIGYYLLSTAVFYLIFDKNYSRSLFFLEEFMRTSLYKKSFIVKVQVSLIKIQLLKDYKRFLIKDPVKNAILLSKPLPKPESFSEMLKVYRQLRKYIYVENFLKETLSKYSFLINEFNDNEIKFETFFTRLKEFGESLKTTDNIIRYSLNDEICSNYFFCSKLSVYYRFFWKEIEKNFRIFFRSFFDFDLIPRDNFSTMILSTITNTDTWKFQIEFASDDLCSELGYMSMEIKNKELSDLFPSNLSGPYYYHFSRKIKKGAVKINIREICFLDKENYANLYDFVGIVICRGDHSKIFAKVQANYNQQKKIIHPKKSKFEIHKTKTMRNLRDTCFILAGKTGKITSISRDFEKYFSLSLSMIYKLKINIVKDILKLESINNKDCVRKKLVDVYENIAELNMSQMFESFNDDFSKTYKSIKGIQKKLRSKTKTVNIVSNFEKRGIKKNDNEQLKEYFLILFTIEMDNTNMPTSLKEFLGDIKAETKSLSSSHQLEELDSPSKAIDITLSTTLCEDLNDITSKIKNIRHSSIKRLKTLYNISKKDIFLNNEDDESNKTLIVHVNTITNPTHSGMLADDEKTNNSVNARTFQGGYTSIPNLSTKEVLNNQTSSKVIFQLIIWIISLCIFIILLLWISQLRDSLNLTAVAIFNAHCSLTSSKKILSEIVSSVLYLRFQVNHLQHEVIDNRFSNRLQDHRQILQNRIQDYLNYFKYFQQNYEATIGSVITKDIEDILQEVSNYVTLGTDNISVYVQSTLWESLCFFHLVANKILYDEHFNELFFNITDNSNLSTNQPIQSTHIYKTIANVTNESDAASVFILENYISRIKYPLDEILNIYLETLHFHREFSSNVILIINSAVTILFLLLFIMQSFIYHRVNNIIFAKYYINFNYIQYFHLFLTRKIALLTEFMDNSTAKEYQKLQKTKISIVNPKEENKKIRNTTKKYENPLENAIQPFRINVMYSKENTKGSNQNLNEDLFKDPLTPINCERQSAMKISSHIQAPSKFKNLQMSYQNLDAIFTKAPEAKCVSKDEDKKMPMKIPEDEDNSNVRSIINLKIQNNEPVNESKTRFAGNKNTTSLSNTVNLTHTKLLAKPEFPIGRKKEINRPKSFFINLFIFLSSAAVIFALTFINFCLTNQFGRLFCDFAKYQKITTERLGLLSDMLLIYQLSLLKNDEIRFFYVSHGYLNNTLPTSEINLNKYHVAFEESILLYHYYIEGLANLTNGGAPDFLENVIAYEKNIEAPIFCEYYANFYFENSNSYSYSLLNVMSNATKELLTSECKTVGKGFNDKGLVAAMNGMYTSLISLYTDFKREGNRTAESNYMRLNNPSLQTYQVEMDKVIDKIWINYLICFTMDRIKMQDSLEYQTNIFKSAMIILLLLLGLIYIWKFTYKFIEDDAIIEGVQDCIYNSLIF